MIRKRKLYWIIGIVLAIIGVFLVRVVSLNAIGYPKAGILLTGFTIAILGLFVIALGTRRT